MSGGSTTPEARGTIPVAVVIVSWNSERYLPACLDSLAAMERPPAEIVVVDSGSTDGSVAYVRRRHPDVRVIECGDNVGFCRGNNLGIAATDSPLVLALNPDTEVEPDFLEQLVPSFDDPAVGIATGKLLRFDRKTLDSAGQELSRSRRPRDRGYGRLDQGQFERDEDVFGACGAAALYRRAMLESIAGPDGQVFDERFFAFGEDLDVAWRGRRRGWRGVYRHRAVAYHERGGTATRAPWLRRWVAILGRSPEVRYHVVKNRYLTILRNDSVAGYLANLPFIWGRDLCVLGLLLVTSPGVLARVWANRGLFSETLILRRLDEARAGDHVQEGRPG